MTATINLLNQRPRRSKRIADLRLKEAEVRACTKPPGRRSNTQNLKQKITTQIIAENGLSSKPCLQHSTLPPTPSASTERPPPTPRWYHSSDARHTNDIHVQEKEEEKSPRQLYTTSLERAPLILVHNRERQHQQPTMFYNSSLIECHCKRSIEEKEKKQQQEIKVEVKKENEMLVQKESPRGIADPLIITPSSPILSQSPTQPQIQTPQPSPQLAQQQTQMQTPPRQASPGSGPVSSTRHKSGQMETLKTPINDTKKKTISPVKQSSHILVSSKCYEDSTVFLSDRIPLPLLRIKRTLLQRALDTVWSTTVSLVRTLFDRPVASSHIEQSVTSWSSQNPYWP